MIQKYFFSFLVMSLGAGLGLLVHFGLARLLGAEAYGTYSFIYALAATTALLMLFGFETAVVRLIPTHQEQQEHAGIRALIGFSFKLTCALALLGGGLVFGGLYVFGFTDKYSALSLLAGAALVFLLTTLRLNCGFLRGFQRGIYSVFYDVTFREIGMFIFVIASFTGIFVLNNAQDALGALSLVLLLSSSAAYFTRRKIAQQYDIPAAAPKTDTRQIKEWLRVSFPMLLLAAARRLLQRIDVIMLGFLVEPALVGAYALAVLLAEGTTIASRPTLAHFSPKVAAQYHSNNISYLRQTFFQARNFMALVQIPIIIVLAVITPYILPFFGEGFSASYAPLLILLAAQAIQTLCGPVDDLLTMTAYEKQTLYITATVSLLNVILNPIMIHYFSITGAALSTAFLLVLWNVTCLWLIRRKALLRSA